MNKVFSTVLVGMVLFAIPGAGFVLNRCVMQCRGELDKLKLRQLWQEFRNKPAPQDVIAARIDLIDQVQAHQRLSSEYATAGGIDRYYRTAGLDSALTEIRARR